MPESVHPVVVVIAVPVNVQPVSTARTAVSGVHVVTMASVATHEMVSVYASPVLTGGNVTNYAHLVPMVGNVCKSVHVKTVTVHTIPATASAIPALPVQIVKINVIQDGGDEIVCPFVNAAMENAIQLMVRVSVQLVMLVETVKRLAQWVPTDSTVGNNVIVTVANHVIPFLVLASVQLERPAPIAIRIANQVHLA